jgi:hypothetical protein
LPKGLIAAQQAFVQAFGAPDALLVLADKLAQLPCRGIGRVELDGFVEEFQSRGKAPFGGQPFSIAE